MQKWSDKYKSYTAGQYYLFLSKSLLYNQFMKTFFKNIQEKKKRFDNFK